MNDQKQPILQWKTKKRPRRQRDDNHNLILDVFQAESINHNDKNGDGSPTTYSDGNTGGPLIIPVAPDQNKWKQKQQQPTVLLAPEPNSSIDDLTAIQALHDDTVTDRSLKNNDRRTSSVKIPSHANTFVAVGNTSQTTLDDREIKQYHKDIDALPAELNETAEEYQRVPINEFGAALLRGMGWKDDTAAHPSVPEIDDIMPRPHRLGLGAIPAILPEPDSNGGRRPRNIDQYQRDQRKQKQHDMYRIEREKKIAEDLQRTLQDGSIVYLMQRDNNDNETLPKQKNRARILKLVGVPGLNMVQVQMEHSGSSIVIKRSEIDGLVERLELEKYPFQEKTTIVEHRTKNIVQHSAISTTPPHHDQNSNNRDRMHGLKDKKRSRSDKREEMSTASWVIPNIRVRIVSEKLGRRYYKEKGIVLDVTRHGGATLKFNSHISSSSRSADGNTPVEAVLDRIPERYLETVLPPIGGNVIIVNPKHTSKYAKGRYIERDGKDKSYGIVQLYDDMDCLRLPLDDIAEWCGDDS